ncbi:UNVERIFIED_CONTAM: hypothetical protein FKN15_001112 [Acipenser sinensis]
MPKNEEFLNIIMEYCKWRDDGASMISDDEGFGAGSSASTSQQHQQVNADSMDLMFKSQKQCVKNSIECKWHLAEAQQKLCSLELHNSESLEQEHAKAQADSSELRQTEQEWRHKEKMLIWGERQNPLLSNAFSREVFDKSFINIQSGNKEADEDRSKSFVQQYEEQLKHFALCGPMSDLADIAIIPIQSNVGPCPTSSKTQKRVSSCFFSGKSRENHSMAEWEQQEPRQAEKKGVSHE